MGDSGLSFKRILLQIFVVSLLIYGCGYFFGGAAIINGFVAGLAAGISFYLILYYQIAKYTDLSYNNENAVQNIRYGWMIRFGILILALILLEYIPANYVLAAIPGFFLPPVVIFINAMSVAVK